MRAIAITFTLAGLCVAQVPAIAIFKTADDAARALVDAAKKPGNQGFLQLFGDSSKDLFPATPETEKLAAEFAKAAGEKLNIDIDPTTQSVATIEVGENQWPFPFPLVRVGDSWQFDVAEGRREIYARRIGADELAAIAACRGFVAAQQDYASQDRNGDGIQEYAQKILSTAGQKDGLYWDGPDSLITNPAAKEFAASAQPGKPRPFRGYYFKILKGQGPDALGGTANYMVQNRMMGGFALLAWPAQYGLTGVRSFIVNHDGILFEKDLGIGTAAAAAGITRFNPDRTWSPVVD